MKPVLEFFPIVLFFVAYKLYDIYVATAVVIVATIVQVAAYWLLYRKVETMHWITLGLILVMGGATLYLQDEQFIKWKLTIIEWLFGGAFLVSQFIGNKTFIERMMGANLELPTRIWKRLNLSWSLFFIGVGFLNLYVMAHYSTDDWVSFKTFGVPGLMVVFIVVQMAFLYKHVPAPETKK
ncbi:septation protein A [Methylomonas sp. MED-D]|uniref:Inner membrane-spanning protein YciB n=1 Tax=Methylomonas koyamae TaxID=702114 RepID=A0A177NJT7_9GAMM|nr:MULTISPECIES: septation protein A [Methylomonas]MDT4332656.1 septation protein A [Methylomonas sp. MV1]NJA07293.1 septation protein A [Methylococcaceae bacterium WWC4]OAI17459.1 septation protein A [Methylomonas koyamae]OHX34542.1 septation protein A [Methylomonas sp. LWB]